jgi:hypothetical protein
VSGEQLPAVNTWVKLMEINCKYVQWLQCYTRMDENGKDNKMHLFAFLTNFRSISRITINCLLSENKIYIEHSTRTSGSIRNAEKVALLKFCLKTNNNNQLIASVAGSRQAFTDMLYQESAAVGDLSRAPGLKFFLTATITATISNTTFQNFQNKKRMRLL